MNTGENKTKSAVLLLRVTAYLMAVLAVFLTFSVLCADQSVDVKAVEPGVLDLRDFDFKNDIANIGINAEAIYIYQGSFYTAEDFASADVLEKGFMHGEEPMGDYGTLRMILKLPPGEIYAIAAKSVSYAQRVYADGKEINSVGQPGKTIEDVMASNRRYFAQFYARGETTEIIVHYSAFVHADGGGLFPITIGLGQNVVYAEKLRTLFEGVLAASLLTAALFFFGLFLFFQKRLYLLWFSLLSACIAVLALSFNNNAFMLLFPDVSWHVLIRIAYIDTCCIGLLSALYINSLFPGKANIWALRGFIIYCGIVTLFITLSPTTVFTRYPTQLNRSYAAFLVYMLIVIIVDALRGKLSSELKKTEVLLLISGIALYILFSTIAISAFPNSSLFFGWEYQSVGIMVFMFLNVLALSLIFSRTEQELHISRLHEQEMLETNKMLEGLNRVKSEFLGNISHEMRTPLEIISGSAGLAATHIERGIVSEQTLKKLDSIQEESVRLGRLVGDLLEAAKENEHKLALRDIDDAFIIKKAIDFCQLICREKGNQLEYIKTAETITMRVDADGIYQVLLNLILNANKHTRNGIITISAKKESTCTVLTVSDNGDGIPQSLLPYVLQRGVSGNRGSGLGLSICKRIIDEHGGDITIKSSKGAGTTVTITLPDTIEEAMI